MWRPRTSAIVPTLPKRRSSKKVNPMTPTFLSDFEPFPCTNLGNRTVSTRVSWLNPVLSCTGNVFKEGRVGHQAVTVDKRVHENPHAPNLTEATVTGIGVSVNVRGSMGAQGRG